MAPSALPSVQGRGPPLFVLILCLRLLRRGYELHLWLPHQLVASLQETVRVRGSRHLWTRRLLLLPVAVPRSPSSFPDHRRAPHPPLLPDRHHPCPRLHLSFTHRHPPCTRPHPHSTSPHPPSPPAAARLGEVTLPRLSIHSQATPRHVGGREGRIRASAAPALLVTSRTGARRCPPSTLASWQASHGHLLGRMPLAVTEALGPLAQLVTSSGDATRRKWWWMVRWRCGWREKDRPSTQPLMVAAVTCRRVAVTATVSSSLQDSSTRPPRPLPQTP